jgi:hypothetical protein
MTRKRTRENLVQQLCEPCSWCEGRGYVLSAESVAYKVLREIRKDLPRFCGRRIALSVHPSVAEMLLTRARKAVAGLGQELGREIEIRARPGQHPEHFEVAALDPGPPVELRLAWLREPAPAAEAPAGPGADPAPEATPDPGLQPATESSAGPPSAAGEPAAEPAEAVAEAATPAPAELLDAAGGGPILPPSEGIEER